MKMQTAHATKVLEGPWKVRGEDLEELFELDADLTEQQVMQSIHLARKFEQLAFDTATAIQKSISKETEANIRSIGQKQMDELNNHIAGLSSELLRLMEEEE